jgi:hypothetical protein
MGDFTVCNHVHAKLSGLKFRYGYGAKGCIPVRLIRENAETQALAVVCEAWMPEEEAKQFVFDNCFSVLNRKEYAAAVSRGWLPCITVHNTNSLYTLCAGTGGV